MNKCKIIIWGRKFELPLMYECYDGEEILESQKEAFTLFEDNAKEVAGSLDQVKKYVKEDEASQLAGIEIENIFKYVMPREIFVPHREKHRMVAIICDYRFDMEHGIAVVFENGRFKEVGPQDIAL